MADYHPVETPVNANPPCRPENSNPASDLLVSSGLKRKQPEAGIERVHKVACTARHCYSGQNPVASNYMNFLKTGCPRRVMFYSKGEWTSFTQNAMAPIIEAFLSKRSSVEVSISEVPHLFDFLSMVLVNLENGNQQSIAWIDEFDKCFFPAFFIKENDSGSDDEDRSNLEASSNDDNCSDNTEACSQSVTFQPRMVREVVAENGGPSLVRRTDAGKTLHSELVRIERGSERFLSVMGTFLSGMGTFSEPNNVVGIWRFTPKVSTSQARLKMFEKQKNATATQRGDANLRNGWLGTSRERLSKVLTHGFHKAVRLFMGAAYGTGVHLAPENRSFACANHCDDDENGFRYMLLCQVIMGNMEQIPAGSMQNVPSKSDFDCGVDNLLNPRHYIVWESHLNAYIHADYVICFSLSPVVRDYISKLTNMGGPSLIMTRHQPNTANSNSVVGAMISKAPSSPWVSFSTLFSEIGDSVPSISKELLSLHYQEYQHQMISREELVRRMRVIVGDRILISALGRLQQKPSSYPNSGIKG